MGNRTTGRGMRARVTQVARRRSEQGDPVRENKGLDLGASLVHSETSEDTGKRAGKVAGASPRRDFILEGSGPEEQ